MYRDEAVRRTFLLCRELLEYLPSPKGSLETLPGLAESRRVPCTACAARGRVSGPRKLPCVRCDPKTGPDRPGSEASFPHACWPCLNCNGTGWKRKRKSDPAWDEYARVELGEPGTRTDDRQLERAKLVLKMWESPDEVEVDWEAKRKRMWEQGSFADLVLALSILEQENHDLHRLVWRAVVLGWVDLETPARGIMRLSESRLGDLNAALYHIAHDLMPAKIRVPYHLRPNAKLAKDSLWRGRSPSHTQSRSQRDAEIVRRVGEGWKVSRLAREYALTEKRVRQIVNASRTKEEAA